MLEWNNPAPRLIASLYTIRGRHIQKEGLRLARRSCNGQRTH